MDYLDTLLDVHIECETANLVESLLEQYLPALTACDMPLAAVLQRIEKRYPFTFLPSDSIHYARTALAVIEAYFPNDAEYLPLDPDDRVQAACSLIQTLGLDIQCAEILCEGNGHTLYEYQRAQFEQRTSGFPLTWAPMPIRICAETTTGYCLVTGCDFLRDDILCLRGVSQFDIDTRSPALIAYLRAKHDMQNR